MMVYLAMLDKCNKCLLKNDSNVTNTVAGDSQCDMNNNTVANSVASVTSCVFQIVLLDKQTLEIPINTKDTIGDLYQKLCEHLELDDADIFGLAKKTKNEYHFLPNDTKISRLYSFSKRTNSIEYSSFSTDSTIASSNKSSPATNNTKRNVTKNPLVEASQHNICYQNSFAFKLFSSLHAKNLFHFASLKVGSSASYTVQQASKETTQFNSLCACNLTCGLDLKLYLRVKFYVNDPLLLANAQTRILYYKQLRNNYLSISHRMNEERYFELASLALVADHGPFDPKKHTGKYFDVNSYFPSWLINKLGDCYIYENMPRLHKQESRISQDKALNKFCVELCNEDEYPFNINLNTVYKHKDEVKMNSICLGISPKGILVFEIRSSGSEINLISTFNWSSVVKLNSDKKKFEVQINVNGVTRKYTYYTASDKLSKYLLEMSKMTHAFTTNVFSRLADQKKLSNYVSESYTDKIFRYGEFQAEIFQEREVREATPQPVVEYLKDLKLSETLEQENIEINISNSSEISTASVSISLQEIENSCVSLEATSQSDTKYNTAMYNNNNNNIAARLKLLHTIETGDVTQNYADDELEITK